LVKKEEEKGGRFLIGTVKGDLHDIGKNIVATMLKGVGFEIWDLGTSVDADAFIKAIKEYQPNILGLSALLTTTMLQMKTVIQAISEAGLRDKVKVIVGGAPVNQKFANDIGADGYAEDAGAAVSVAKKLMKN
jgi:5-methyltetrahydrofolate--homocysteine methyltransferase